MRRASPTRWRRSTSSCPTRATLAASRATRTTTTSASRTTAAACPQAAPDGRWYWDGTTWRTALSPDGRWRWNGYTWVAVGGGLSAGWIAAIAGGVVVVLLAAMVPVVLLFNAATHLTPVGSQPSPAASPAPTSFTTIPCDQLEHTQVHYHAYLQIPNQGSRVSIPTNVGRSSACYYWLHMHTNEAGIIHIESPSDRTFTLGDFFDVWR